jgi:hypothetical protein
MFFCDMCSHALICLVLLVDGFPLKIYMYIYRVFLLVKEFILILRCTTVVIGFGHRVSSSPGFRLIFRVSIQIGGLDFC